MSLDSLRLPRQLSLSTHELYGSRGNVNDLLDVTFRKHLIRASISVSILSQQKVAKWSRQHYTLVCSFHSRVERTRWLIYKTSFMLWGRYSLSRSPHIMIPGAGKWILTGDVYQHSVLGVLRLFAATLFMVWEPSQNPFTRPYRMRSRKTYPCQL